jgi:hypothetical protein
MSPDAEDGSPSPGPGVDRESSSIMAEEKIERASTDEISPARTGPETKPPPKSNPKDPSRPRRKKARRACFACQRAHLTCGNLWNWKDHGTRADKYCRRRKTLSQVY